MLNRVASRRLAKWYAHSMKISRTSPGTCKSSTEPALMLKSAGTYKETQGWGWGRWKGLDPKPYGKDARFVNECTSCHLPVRGNDYVYTLPITTANVNGDQIVNNAAAALPFNLPHQPLGWGAITMYVDPKTRTTATLYGNDIAMNTIRSLHSKAIVAGERAYGDGAVLALITWAQRDDPHWFGGRIPQRFQTVEFVVTGAAGSKTYSRYDAAEQPQDHAGRSKASQRTNFMLALAPAQLP